MKKLKLFSYSVLVGFTMLLIYSNVRQVSPVERIKPVKLATYSLAGIMLEAERSQLETQIKSLPGVTACSIGKDIAFASVVFYSDQISEEELMPYFKIRGNFHVSKARWKNSTSGGCPIPKINSSWKNVLTSLDLRNKF